MALPNSHWRAHTSLLDRRERATRAEMSSHVHDRRRMERTALRSTDADDSSDDVDSSRGIHRVRPHRPSSRFARWVASPSGRFQILLLGAVVVGMVHIALHQGTRLTEGDATVNARHSLSFLRYAQDAISMTPLASTQAPQAPENDEGTPQVTSMVPEVTEVSTWPPESAVVTTTVAQTPQVDPLAESTSELTGPPALSPSPMSTPLPPEATVVEQGNKVTAQPADGIMDEAVESSNPNKPRQDELEGEVLGDSMNSPVLSAKVDDAENAHAKVDGDQGGKEKKSLQSPTNCYDERDDGIVVKLRESVKRYCEDASPAESERWTKVEYYNVPGGIKATVLENLELDLRGARIYRPIRDIAQDGGNHDPRFKYTNRIVHCRCDEFAQEAQRKRRNPFLVWDPTLARHPRNKDLPSTVCRVGQQLSSGLSDDHLLEVVDKTILIARRDDHNPFFQISVAMNSWIMMQVLNWQPDEVQLVYLDDGFPSAIDELQHKLLAPSQEPIHGKRLRNKVLHFQGPVLVAPYEVSGPMMQHLDDDEPCYDSALLKRFRLQSLQTILGDEMDNNAVAQKETTGIVITIISRRNYQGRTIQRRWLNEDEIVRLMRERYSGLDVKIQSIDFVQLSLAEQMRIVLQSDVLIGMHGAGMVNVIWSRPETLVVEIFPKKRFRWGYRNLCQFLGCSWHEYRGGKDTGLGDNKSDKTLDYDEWMAFFHPLLKKVVHNTRRL